MHQHVLLHGVLLLLPQVLPAVYLFVGRSLNATPVQLGTLTLCRAMVQVWCHAVLGTIVATSCLTRYIHPTCSGQ